jgi:hypothetical protein
MITEHGFETQEDEDEWIAADQDSEHEDVMGVWARFASNYLHRERNMPVLLRLCAHPSLLPIDRGDYLSSSLAWIIATSNPNYFPRMILGECANVEELLHLDVMERARQRAEGRSLTDYDCALTKLVAKDDLGWQSPNRAIARKLAGLGVEGAATHLGIVRQVEVDHGVRLLPPEENPWKAVL